ncbi:MAG: ABC transporter ATP-binding protein [Candidatus Bipolaricaulia bacterium]
MTDPVLEVNNLTTHYFTDKGEVQALDDANFKLAKGQSMGVAGESGCGKSTMAFSLINQVQPPGRIVNGEVLIDGIDAVQLSENQIRKKVRWKRISMVFQGAMDILTPVYTVGHQMKEPLYYHKGIEGAEAREKCEGYLGSVGLDSEIFTRYPHELSGGQKQRVIIATSLLLEPNVLIADEPTTSLDVVVEAQIMNLLKRLKKELGISMIFITHDLSILSEVSNNLSIMYAGKFAELGNAKRIYENPKHPYTEKLLASIPRLHKDVERLERIPGAPPNLVDPPSGCRFHPRCTYARKQCKEVVPEIRELEGRKVACHFAEEVPGGGS